MKPLTLALLAITVATVTAAPAPQQVRAEDLLARATEYIGDFIRRFSSVVSEELYLQDAAFLPRVTGTGFGKTFDQPTPIHLALKSEFLLVRREATAEWNTFRDVFEVDGRAVRDRDDRLLKLLLEPARCGRSSARVAAEGAPIASAAPAHHHNPLVVDGLLQRRYQSRYRFALGKGCGSRIDRPGPRIHRSREADAAAGEQSKSAGERAPLDRLDNGRIVKTELVLRIRPVVTTFRTTSAFRLRAPARCGSRLRWPGLLRRITRPTVDSGGSVCLPRRRFNPRTRDPQPAGGEGAVR